MDADGKLPALLGPGQPVSDLRGDPPDTNKRKATARSASAEQPRLNSERPPSAQCLWHRATQSRARVPDASGPSGRFPRFGDLNATAPRTRRAGTPPHHPPSSSSTLLAQELPFL